MASATVPSLSPDGSIRYPNGVVGKITSYSPSRSAVGSCLRPFGSSCPEFSFMSEELPVCGLLPRAYEFGVSNVSNMVALMLGSFFDTRPIS